MKKIAIGILFAALFTSNQVRAQSISYELCLEVADAINQTTPLLINQFSTLSSALCFPQGRGSKLIYIYQVSGDGRYNLGADQTQLVTNFWCTSDETRDLLNSLAAVEFRYHDDMGRHLKTFEIDRTDC